MEHIESNDTDELRAEQMDAKSFKAVLSGFESMEQAANFLKWFEGQGEQDDTIGEWIGGVSRIRCDVAGGMVELSDGFEYKVKIFKE